MFQKVPTDASGSECESHQDRRAYPFVATVIGGTLLVLSGCIVWHWSSLEVAPQTWQIVKIYYINVAGADTRNAFMQKQLQATGIPFERFPAVNLRSWQEALSKYWPQMERRGLDRFIIQPLTCTDSKAWRRKESCRKVPPNAKQPWLRNFAECLRSWDPSDLALVGQACPFYPRRKGLAATPLDQFYNLTELGYNLLSNQTDRVFTFHDSRALLGLMLSHELLLDHIHDHFKDRVELGDDALVLILEDDATVPADLQRRLDRVLPLVPSDWSSVRLGFYGEFRIADRVNHCVLEPRPPFGAINLAPGVEALGTEHHYKGLPMRYYYSGAHAYLVAARGARLRKFRDHVRSLPITHHWLEAVMASGPDGYKQYLLQYPLSNQSEELNSGVHNHTSGLSPVGLRANSAWGRYCMGEPGATRPTIRRHGHV